MVNMLVLQYRINLLMVMVVITTNYTLTYKMYIMFTLEAASKFDRNAHLLQYIMFINVIFSAIRLNARILILDGLIIEPTTTASFTNLLCLKL